MLGAHEIQNTFTWFSIPISFLFKFCNYNRLFFSHCTTWKKKDGEKTIFSCFYLKIPNQCLEIFIDFDLNLRFKILTLLVVLFFALYTFLEDHHHRLLAFTFLFEQFLRNVSRVSHFCLRIPISIKINRLKWTTLKRVIDFFFFCSK